MAYTFPTGTNDALSKIGSGVTITEEPSTMEVINPAVGDKLRENELAAQQANAQAGELAQQQGVLKKTQQSLVDSNADQDKRLDYQKYANAAQSLQSLNAAQPSSQSASSTTYTPHSHPTVSVAPPEKEKNNMEGVMKLVGTVLAFL